MKLLYIANVRLPTEKVHGMQIARMADAFQKCGHSVELIIPRLGRNSTTTEEFYNLETTLTIRRIPTWPWRASWLSFVLSSVIFGILSVLYASWKKGVIYSIDLDDFSFFLIPFLRKPYFFEMHAPKKRTIPLRLLFSRITGVIATSENTRRELERTFPRLSGRTSIEPSGGIDAKKYEHMPARYDMEHPAVVYTGSFQWWKGLDIAIEAARKMPDVHWYLVGDDEKKLGEKELPNNVHTAPWGPTPDAGIPWQKGADILLLSGTNKDEYSAKFTSPTKTYEYMAAEGPVLAAATSAISHAVSDELVFLYEPDNADDLAKKVTYMLSHPDKVKEKVKKAKQKALSFTWEHRAQSIIDFIQTHAEE